MDTSVAHRPKAAGVRDRAAAPHRGGVARRGEVNQKGASREGRMIQRGKKATHPLATAHIDTIEMIDERIFSFCFP